MFANIDFSQYYEEAFIVLINRVPKIILILILIWAAKRVLQLVLKRMSVGVGKNAIHVSDPKKVKTHISILASVGNTAILSIGIIMILNELNINIVPLIAGVGILGLAIGFGAQALVKDFITGFFMLLENQYDVDDFISIGGKSGTVESVTLRVTRLRDYEGKVHFIPHGGIGEVTNHSREWGRGILNFEVPYGEDTSKVISALSGICDSMANDAEYGSMFIEPPEVTGVENLGDDSVRIRVIAKTHHDKKFNFLREFRLRAKKRFDELGITNARRENAVWLMNKGEAGAVGVN